MVYQIYNGTVDDDGTIYIDGEYDAKGNPLELKDLLKAEPPANDGITEKIYLNGDDWDPGKDDSFKLSFGKGNDDTSIVYLDLAEFETSPEITASSCGDEDIIHLTNAIAIGEIGNYLPLASFFDGDTTPGTPGDFDTTADDDTTYWIIYINNEGDPRVAQFSTDCAMTIRVSWVCFARGTMIDIGDGKSVPVEQLKPGDLVQTRDNGLQPIQWLASRKVGVSELSHDSALRPVRFTAGSLGKGVPSKDLLLSQQHRVVLDTAECALLFGHEQALAPAKAFINNSTIAIDYKVEDVEYFHFMCGAHEVVYADGAEVETFFPDQEGLLSLSEDLRAELLKIFPDIDILEELETKAHFPVLRFFEAELALKAKEGRPTV
ncbi:Hint domain-containing protein [Shimia sp. R10_1]|uniref:Hint domain-containing protein n=1 Tax=Shimia sp. R10_1 TaxID=2821095 RepID=UPI001ADA08F5|nr:Hint domain-containing protein [Shimia sp. R10_1]MBO9474765.1 Hint domain-containing protein [Shimia sp. R10_1]